ncbi:MAG: Crp/Fnr family transcriptional regulator [Hyphomicrobium sp.]
MAKVLDWNSISATVPLIGTLPDRYRQGVALRQVTKGEPIFRRGDKPRYMLAVLSGEVRLVRSSPHGGEVIFQRARRGLLAEASLDQPRYHCDAVAAEDSELIAVPRNAFRDALTVDVFRDRWTTHLLQELRRVRAHAERLSLHKARDRIVHYIEAEGENGSVVLNQSKKDWAAELALTHEALYRALANMEANGELTVLQSRLVFVGSR